jgi:hypothetical protein
MNKLEAIKEISEAKANHEIQMDKLERLFDGDVIHHPTPVDKTQCDFGKWLYGSKEKIKGVLGEELYEELDIYHDKWHRDYDEIHEAFYNKPKKNILYKVLHLDGMDPVTEKMTEFYHNEVRIDSLKLIDAIDASMAKVLSLPDTE